MSRPDPSKQDLYGGSKLRAYGQGKRVFNDNPWAVNLD